MDSLSQDKEKSECATDATKAVPATPSAPHKIPVPDGELSWGDKYKRGTLHFIRNILGNYIVNFAISAIGTYAVLNNATLKEKLTKVSDWAVKHGSKVNMPPKLSEGLADFFTTTQILLCGGHALLPFMKYTHDNRHKLEFDIGHKLDRLQEKLGRGNQASKRNIAEYKYVSDLMKAKPAEVSDEDKSLLTKHNIGDDFQFKEHRETWKHMVKARLAGMSFTTTLSILFGLSGKLPKPYQMKTIEGHAGKFISEHGLNKIPKTIISKPEELGQYMFLELIYTAFSKLGFDKMERRMLKKQEKEEADKAVSNLDNDRKVLGEVGIRAQDADDIAQLRTEMVKMPSALETRRKLAERGEQDFRAREASKPLEPSMAIS